MNIQMTDLKEQYENIKSEIDAAIQKVINETSFILGQEVKLFEDDICKYFNSKYAVACASGTDALVLSLLALDIGHGDEVITTPFTFIATAEAISRVRAKPVFCDIEPDTFNIDPIQIEKKISSKTKAIIPVHLYGMPADMGKILSIAKSKNIKVIEDCAQSFGSEFDGKKTGIFGDCGTLSFFPAKTLGCFGDGGMVLAKDEKVAQKLQVLRNHGSAQRYFYSLHGFNSRLDTIQAAILRIKLKFIDQWIQQRINNADIYKNSLSGIVNIVVPVEKNGYKHTFNYYNLRVKSGRDLLEKKLKDNGIASAIYYPLSLHLQEVYKDLGYRLGDFPVSELAQEQVLALPMYPELTKEKILKITEVIK